MLVYLFYRYGIQYENVAKDAFETLTKMKIVPCGLFIDKKLNFLAASPDGLVDDGIIEIKCPSSIKNITPQEAAHTKSIKYLIVDKRGNIKLKRTCQYFYQVQGQLHITQRQNCYFIVWTPNGMFTYTFIL